MSKINLRDLGTYATQWDHPIKGLLKCVESINKCSGDILKIPKKMREAYAIGIAALALMDDLKIDWWVNFPSKDPPDGLVMTFVEVKPKGLKGNVRQIEVVEHRTEAEDLFNVIKTKMEDTAYDPNTALLCLTLTPALQNLEDLSKKLISIKSKIKYVFVVFAGVSALKEDISEDHLKYFFTMVQLLPVFYRRSFDFRPYLDDFEKRCNLGQESRLIRDNQVFFATANPELIS